MHIDDAILRADLIVSGEISSNGIGSYEFNIQETLFGDSTLKTIQVEKWEEWRCDARDFKIRKGQRLILLLRKDESGYYPINGSTGEIPIRGGDVPARNGYYEVLPFSVPVEEFCDAVRALRGCCHITEMNEDFGYFYKHQWDCKAAERSTLSAKSKFAGWLFGVVENREKKE